MDLEDALFHLKGEKTAPSDNAVESISSLSLSLVIPTYQESKNIERLVARLVDVLDNGYYGKYELIIVDDDSPDGTWKIAEGLSRSLPQVAAIRRVGERGLSSAVMEGWRRARGDLLGVIDADLQHPPETITKLLESMAPEIDLVVGSRHVDDGGVSDWSLRRRVISRVAQVIGLLILPRLFAQVSDPMSGYFIVRRSVVDATKLKPRGYKILVEILGRHNIRAVKEVGYIFQEREIGHSKADLRVYRDYLLQLALLRMQGLPVARFIRFCFVGASGVFVDTALLYLLSDPTQLNWGLTRSKFVAAEIAIINNFIWNEVWAFRDRSSSGAHKLRRFAKFNVICTAGLLMNILILNILFNFIEVNRYTANIIAILIVTVWNYWLNANVTWSKRRV